MLGLFREISVELDTIFISQYMCSDAGPPILIIYALNNMTFGEPITKNHIFRFYSSVIIFNIKYDIILLSTLCKFI